MTRTIDFGLVKHLIVKMNNSNNAIMILFVSQLLCNEIVLLTGLVHKAKTKGRKTQSNRVKGSSIFIRMTRQPG